MSLPPPPGNPLWFRSLGERYRLLPHLGQRLLVIGLAVTLLSFMMAMVYGSLDRVLAIGIISTVLAGLATGVGALPVLWVREIDQKMLNLLLGGAAGVMMAATSFSLIVPAIAAGNQLWPGLGVYYVALGLLLGAGFLVFADHWLPFEKYLAQGESFDSLRKVWLFIAAITLHNLPEGGAVGVSFGGGDWRSGVSIALAVALQNIPEGLAVALPLVGLGYRRENAVLIALMTGLIEPVGGLLGLFMATSFLPFMPIGMAIAAGAMLFVIMDDIIPETQSQGKARYATFAALIGFIIMMVLDNLIVSL